MPQPQPGQQPWQGYQAPQHQPGQQPWQGYQAPPRPKRMGVGAWIAIGGALAIFLLVGFVLLGNSFATPAGGSSGSPSSNSGSPGKASGGAQDSGMGFEFNLNYGLAIPGVAYTQAAGGDKIRYVVSSGVKTQSVLMIKPDGTYVWDSAWDGKVIKGSWEKTGDPGSPIRLKKAQEGKDWLVGPDTRPSAKPGTILVLDSSIYYEGYPLK